jgi:hypothetical protein
VRSPEILLMGLCVHTVPNSSRRTVGIVSGVHALGEPTEVVVEEPGVDVEGHRGRGVTAHALDRFHVRTTGHQEAGRGSFWVNQPGRVGSSSPAAAAAS